MKIPRMKVNSIVLYAIAVLVCIIFTTYYVLQPISLIEGDKKNINGKAELFVRNFASPQGMALDNVGRLFVQSSFDGSISVITKDGTAMDYSYLQNNYGYGMTIDAYGNFLLAAGKQMICLDSSGEVIRRIEGFGRIYDVEIGPHNSVFVTDAETGTVYSISPDDKVTVFAELSGSKSTSTANASGLCFDKGFNNLYVLNMYRGELYKISLTESKQAGSIELWASNLQRPNYIDVDSESNAYVTCIGDNTVVRINSNGIKELIDTKGKLANPSGIVISSSGNDKLLYVASRDTNNIYKIPIFSNNEKKK